MSDNRKYPRLSLRKRLLLTAFVFTATLTSGWSQCAMCRAVLESEENGVQAEAINDGIVYLMVFPYLLVGTIAWLIYRSRKKKQPKV